MLIYLVPAGLVSMVNMVQEGTGFRVQRAPKTMAQTMGQARVVQKQAIPL